MKITERIKKIEKLVGSDISYFYSDEFFVPKSLQSKIIGIQINGLFDISLIVKCDGVINPLSTVKSYETFKIVKLPLIKFHMGKYVFPQYGCIGQSIKSIFITKNDIDSSLLKDSEYSLIEEIEEQMKQMKLNLNIKKNFVCDNDLKTMMKMYKLELAEATNLKELGLTPYGWRNTLDETYIFDPSYFNLEVVHEINTLTEKIEELEIYSGLLKLSMERLNKN